MGKKKKKTELKDLRGFKQMPCFYHNLPFMFPLFINEKKKPKQKVKLLVIVTKKIMLVFTVFQSQVGSLDSFKRSEMQVCLSLSSNMPKKLLIKPT